MGTGRRTYGSRRFYGRRPPLRLDGHRATYESGTERGSWTATCTCGWEEYGSTRAVVRDEFAWHLDRVADAMLEQRSDQAKSLTAALEHTEFGGPGGEGWTWAAKGPVQATHQASGFRIQAADAIGGGHVVTLYAPNGDPVDSTGALVTSQAAGVMEAMALRVEDGEAFKATVSHTVAIMKINDGGV